MVQHTGFHGITEILIRIDLDPSLVGTVEKLPAYPKLVWICVVVFYAIFSSCRPVVLCCFFYVDVILYHFNSAGYQHLLAFPPDATFSSDIAWLYADDCPLSCLMLGFIRRSITNNGIRKRAKLGNLTEK